MEKLSKSLTKNIETIKEKLTAEDILVYGFLMPSGRKCTALYVDSITDKQLLGDQVEIPLVRYRGEETFQEIFKTIATPEIKEEKKPEKLIEEILNGNTILLIDGFADALIVGVKKVAMRSIAEPPTDITVKGPRAGFVEDIKTNSALVRQRLKTKTLQFTTINVGKQTNTVVMVCYLTNIADKTTYQNIEKRLKQIDIDGIPDSSYIGKFLSARPHSLFKQVGTCEKPDVLCAKMLEGRVGILVDGSPIALTLPYMLVEDFQASEDYFVSAYRATFTRLLRIFAILIAIYTPALYVAAQLFKLQLIPLGLLLTIASSIQGLPLSPSMEMFLTLMALEILNEASIRMPKYVGMALSIVGALVLGDTAVNAGFLSTPAIMIVALSGICIYAVPNLVETTSVIRLFMLLVAGSVGTYSIVLLSAFLACYIITADSYGTPLLAPFSPMINNDLRDALVKFNIMELKTRPKVFRPKNKVRLKDENE